MTTCALVAASDFNEGFFQAAYSAGRFDAILAVDGGFAFLSRLGIKPDVVLGDFDSLGYVPEGEDVRQFSPHKDKSDLELALELAVAEGHRALEVYGALGGRLDHTLANIQLLARYAELGFRVCAWGAREVVHYVVGPGVCEFPPFESGTVSVFSLTPRSTGVTERGLAYPLDDAVLTDRTTLGLSNEFTGQKASVSVEEGTLIILRSLASDSAILAGGELAGTAG